MICATPLDENSAVLTDQLEVSVKHRKKLEDTIKLIAETGEISGVEVTLESRAHTEQLEDELQSLLAEEQADESQSSNLPSGQGDSGSVQPEQQEGQQRAGEDSGRPDQEAGRIGNGSTEAGSQGDSENNTGRIGQPEQQIQGQTEQKQQNGQPGQTEQKQPNGQLGQPDGQFGQIEQRQPDGQPGQTELPGQGMGTGGAPAF